MDIQYLVVHCADTPNDREVTAEEIHHWHLQRGWDGIGYHKVIKRNGEVENGRPEYWPGSHVKGMNTKSLGVCLIGRDDFTEAQFDSLRIVLGEWIGKYRDVKIVGHYELDGSKTCPNFDVQNWWRMGK
jgi:N-acetylmuramoyl-L-alanine amidase